MEPGVVPLVSREEPLEPALIPLEQALVPMAQACCPTEQDDDPAGKVQWQRRLFLRKMMGVPHSFFLSG